MLPMVVDRLQDGSLVFRTVPFVANGCCSTSRCRWEFIFQDCCLCCKWFVKGLRWELNFQDCCLCCRWLLPGFFSGLLSVLQMVVARLHDWSLVFRIVACVANGCCQALRRGFSFQDCCLCCKWLLLNFKM